MKIQVSEANIHLLQSGTHCATILPPDHKTTIGDTIEIDIIKMNGLSRPYKSFKISTAAIIDVFSKGIRLVQDNGGNYYNLGFEGSEHMALRTGFDNFDHMRAYYEKTHSIPYRGLLVQWRTPK